MITLLRINILSDVRRALNTGHKMPRKRPRAPKAAKALLEQVIGQAYDLEEPLAEAMQLVHALRMLGDGMEADGADEGQPIAAVARAAAARLDELKCAWLVILRSGRASQGGHRHRAPVGANRHGNGRRPSL